MGKGCTLWPLVMERANTEGEGLGDLVMCGEVR